MLSTKVAVGSQEFVFQFSSQSVQYWSTSLMIN